MAYEVRVRLIVTSEDVSAWDAASIISTLGIGEPELNWMKGELHDARSPRIRQNCGLWFRFYSGFDADPIEELARLLDALEASGDRVSALLGSYDCELAITIRLYGEDTPPFHLSSAMLSRIGALALDIDVDLYVLEGYDPRTRESADTT